MKLPYKSLWICAIVALLTLSCSSSDDADKTSVKYTVTSTAAIFTSVMYRNANGEMIEAIGDAPGIEWNRSINVDIPFNAHLEVEVLNGTPDPQDYDVAIYVDGELKDYAPSTVAAGETDALTSDFDLN